MVHISGKSFYSNKGQIRQDKQQSFCYSNWSEYCTEQRQMSTIHIFVINTNNQYTKCIFLHMSICTSSCLFDSIENMPNLSCQYLTKKNLFVKKALFIEE